MAKIETYKRIMDTFDLCYKGIKINSVISLHLFTIAQGQNLNLRKTEFYDIFRFKRLRRITQGREDSYVLFYKGGGTRYNHNKICDYVNNQIQDICTGFTAKQIGVGYTLHPISFIKIFYYVSRWGIKHRLSVSDIIVIFSATMKACNTIIELDHCDFKWVKRFISFMYPFELGDILTQYFNNNKIETIAQSDGLYMDYGIDVPFDAINYLNFKSNKLLLYGDYSKEEYQRIGIPLEKIKVCGYTDNCKQMPLKEHNSFIKCCVLMARNSYEQSNLNLLEQLKLITDKYDFYLKVHPLNDFAKYKEIAEKNGFHIVDKNVTIDECIDKKNFDFTIAVNTTTYYESLIKGVPCFRYCDGSFLLMSGLDDVFDKGDFLISLIDYYKGLNLNDYQSLVNRSLEYSIGFGINNYRKYILE